MHLIFVDYRIYFSFGKLIFFLELNKYYLWSESTPKGLIGGFICTSFISFLCHSYIKSTSQFSCCHKRFLKLPCGTLIVNYLVMLTCLCWHILMCYILKYVIQHFLYNAFSPTNSQRLCQNHKFQFLNCLWKRVSVTNFHLIYPFICNICSRLDTKNKFWNLIVVWSNIMLWFYLCANVMLQSWKDRVEKEEMRCREWNVKISNHFLWCCIDHICNTDIRSTIVT